MSISVKDHLNKIRPLGHEVLKKQGHFKKMAKASAISRKKKKK